MDRRFFGVIAILVSCDRQVDDGVFTPTGSPTTPTTVASGDDGDDGDESRDTSEGSSAGDSATDDDGASEPTFGDPDSSGGDPTDDPSAADPTGNDPTGNDPTGDDPTGDDPTGDDPTGDDPTGASSSCCDVQIVGGCDDPAIEACVCDLDAFCCDVEWDDVCVGQAADCGAACGGGGGGGGGGGDCCIASGLPGCDDPAIEACVCGLDPFCCDFAWDDACVGQATADCLAC